MRDRLSSLTEPSGLRLYLDTADQSQWRDWLPTRLFYGVTTNPLLLERSRVPCTLDSLTRLARAAFDLGAHEVQLQTWGATLDDQVKTGHQLAALDPRIVVKVPITRMGTEAAAKLVANHIPVTLTAVYTAHQVLIATALKAAYAAPYLGRISDLGQDGHAELVAMQQAIAGLHSPTRLLVASIRSVDSLAYLAAQGLNTFTISPAIAHALFDVPATQQAAADFERAAHWMLPE